MVFRKPTLEEVREYKKTNSLLAVLIIQMVIVILFLCPIIFIWCAGEGSSLTLKFAISLTFLAIDKDFILYVIELYMREWNYRKGNYEVYKVGKLDEKKIKTYHIGGKSPTLILTYQLPELGVAAHDCKYEEQKKIEKTREATIIKMWVRGRWIYEMCHTI